MQRDVQAPGDKIPVYRCNNLNDFSDLSSTINTTIGELEIIVSFATLGDLNNFISLILKNPTAKYIAKISELDFGQCSNIESTSDSGPITITIPDALQNLKKLVSAHIGYKVTLNLPLVMNNLETLVINGFRHVVSFPKYMDNLKILDLGDVRGNVSFELPFQVDKLEELKIGTIDIESECDFVLPAEFNSLKSIAIGTLGPKFVFPIALDNLEKLVIDAMTYPFEFPISLNKLKEYEDGGVLWRWILHASKLC